MKEISIEYLSCFEEIFAVDKEKHIVILLTIKSFIQRFEQYPELREKAKLFALNDEWRNHGIFFMTFSSTDKECNIYFDCIDDDSIMILKNALKTFNFTLMTFCFSIRNAFREMIFDLCNEMNLKMHEDTNCACLYLSKHDALKLNYSVPDNYHLRELSSDNVEKINSEWPHRYENSIDFIAYSVKYHMSIGLFDKCDNLVAWCLRYDNGSLAVLQVDDLHKRKGFGEIVVKALSKKIAETLDVDVISLVMHNNTKSLNLFKKLNFKHINDNTWFGLQDQSVMMSSSIDQHSLVEIPIESLPLFRDSFRVNWPEHIMAFNLFNHLIDRFTNHPEHREILKAYSVDAIYDDSTFIAILQDKDIIVGTLDPSFTRLKIGIRLINFDKMKMFMGVRNIYRDFVVEFIKEANLKQLFDDGTAMVYMSKEDALKLEFKIPDDVELKSLSIDDAIKVNSIWPYKNADSEKFIAYVIKNNKSVGICSKMTGELHAWCLEHDYHCLLALQVDDNNQRKGYGSIAAAAITKKIAQEYGVDVITNIIHENYKSLNLFDKIGYKIIDSNWWLGVIKE